MVDDVLILIGDEGAEAEASNRMYMLKPLRSTALCETYYWGGICSREVFEMWNSWSEITQAVPWLESNKESI